MGTRSTLLALGTVVAGLLAVPLISSGCAGGTVSDPLPPAELVGVWNLVEEGSSEETLNPALRSLVLNVTQEGAVIYSDEPDRPLALRMIKDLGEPVDGVREGTAGLVTESGAVIRITIALFEDGGRLRITDNTRLGSPTRVQLFQKVI